MHNAILSALAAMLLSAVQGFGPGSGADVDRRAMLDRLGIAETRPGADGFDPKAANAANYDEAKAAASAPYPEVLRLDDGRTVTSAAMWRNVRRPQIVAAFDREIYGRVPATAPAIRWHVVRETRATEQGFPVIKQWVEGVADNRDWPTASAVIALRVTLPVSKKPVPVILSFGFPEGFRFPGPPRPPEPGPEPDAVILGHGWGHAVIVANSIQADDGGKLSDGVIGIAARGKKRTPDDWGVLRAWAWGASRAFDALAHDSRIDAKRIGIEGLSRYGKAALVTMAYDQRFAIGLIGSSGAGGAAPYRRDFGERIGNLAASGEYHWFAGNFLKYAGPLHVADLPIDAHELIALAAPRPIFIGAGTVDTGDGWVDPRGSFEAAARASPVWRLFGMPGLSRLDFPPVLTPVVGGTVGFRQHQGGHSNRPNWETFLSFADARLQHADTKRAAP